MIGTFLIQSEFRFWSGTPMPVASAAGVHPGVSRETPRALLELHHVHYHASGGGE